MMALHATSALSWIRLSLRLMQTVARLMARARQTGGTII
jgi:hypothetical protein